MTVPTAKENIDVAALVAEVMEQHIKDNLRITADASGDYSGGRIEIRLYYGDEVISKDHIYTSSITSAMRADEYEG